MNPPELGMQASPRASARESWRSRSYEEWTQLHWSVLWCYDSQVEPYGRHADITANYLSAWLVRRGQVSVRSPRGTLNAGPGMWVVPEPGPRRHDFDDKTHLLSVGFTAEWPDGSYLYQGNLGVVFPASEHPALEKAALRLGKAFRKHLDSGFLSRRQMLDFDAYADIQNHLPAWIGALSSALEGLGILPTRRAVQDERLVRSLRVIEAAPLHEPLRRESIASSAGLSPVHLDRLFLQHLGHTVREHVEQRKLAAARDMLAFRNTQIKEAALSLGFKNSTHFTRWFHRKTGKSPSHFRSEQGW